MSDLLATEVYALHNKPIDEVIYFITRNDWNDCIIIDPFEWEGIKTWLATNKKRCSLVILTHEHYDHIGAVNQLKKEYRCTIVASEKCAECVADFRLNFSAYYDVLMQLHGYKENIKTNPYTIEKIDITFNRQLDLYFHDTKIHLVETPGHSPGSICIEIGSALFTGDSLLRDTPAITKFPKGSKKDYNNITYPYLITIDRQTMVYPGHGESFFMKDNQFINAGK